MGSIISPQLKADNITKFAKRRRELLSYDASKIPQPELKYVVWFDVMGAGNMMTVSVEKTANFLFRLHYSIVRNWKELGYTDGIFPMNDGCFVIAENKAQVTSLIGRVMIDLSCIFLTTHRHEDKFLIRSSVAYGPVYSGKELQFGMSKKKLHRFPNFGNNINFGTPVIQSYSVESNAAPFGVCIHESARTFAPFGDRPFQISQWPWWKKPKNADYGSHPSLRELKNRLAEKLQSHFERMKNMNIYLGINAAKIDDYADLCDSYFFLK